MLCQICKNETATIHIQEVIGASKTTLHLCSTCAEKNHVAEDEGNSLKLAALAYQLATDKLNSAQTSAEQTEMPDISCPNCGSSAEELQATGRLGCATCYDAFQEILTPILERMHRGSQHCGSVPPAKTGDSAEITPPPPPNAGVKEINALRIRLRRAVQAENYEQAASLRDQISHLNPDADTQDS